MVDGDFCIDEACVKGLGSIVVELALNRSRV